MQTEEPFGRARAAAIVTGAAQEAEPLELLVEVEAEVDVEVEVEVAVEVGPMLEVELDVEVDVEVALVEIEAVPLMLVMWVVPPELCVVPELVPEDPVVAPELEPIELAVVPAPFPPLAGFEGNAHTPSRHCWRLAQTAHVAPPTPQLAAAADWQMLF